MINIKLIFTKFFCCDRFLKIYDDVMSTVEFQEKDVGFMGQGLEPESIDAASGLIDEFRDILLDLIDKKVHCFDSSHSTNFNLWLSDVDDVAGDESLKVNFKVQLRYPDRPSDQEICNADVTFTLSADGRLSYVITDRFRYYSNFVNFESLSRFFERTKLSEDYSLLDPNSLD